MKWLRRMFTSPPSSDDIAEVEALKAEAKEASERASAAAKRTTGHLDDIKRRNDPLGSLAHAMRQEQQRRIARGEKC